MKLKREALWVLLSASIWSLSAQGRKQKAFTPEDALSSQEIAEIMEKKNFFDRVSAPDEAWNAWKRKYSERLISRPISLGYETVLNGSLKQAFDLRFDAEAMYRSRMGTQIALGAVLPSLDITFGQGASPLSISNVFAGLFSFVLPQGWVNVKIQREMLKVSKLRFMQHALDYSLQVQTTFYQAHKIVHDAEIYAYYLVNLQMLRNNWRDILTDDMWNLDGLIGSVAIDHADALTAVYPQCNNIAKVMVLEKGPSGRYSSDKIVVANLPETLNFVPEIDDFEEVYRDRNTYVKAAVEHSVEVKAADLLYKIAKMQVATTGLQSSLTHVGSQPDHARFHFHLGYDTVPRILNAISLKRSAKIAKNQAYLSILDHARRAHGNYKNAMRQYTESLLALTINRESFRENLEQALQDPRKAGPAFFLSLQRTLSSELAVNNAVHNGLIARAQLNRYVFGDRELHLARYLPSGRDREKALEYFKKLYGGPEFMDTPLDKTIQKVSSSKKLREVLSGQLKNKDGVVASVALDEMKEAVSRNLVYLLGGSIKRSHKFYAILAEYVNQEKVTVSSEERKLLTYYATHSRVGRIFSAPKLAEESSQESEFHIPDSSSNSAG